MRVKDLRILSFAQRDWRQRSAATSLIMKWSERFLFINFFRLDIFIHFMAFDCIMKAYTIQYTIIFELDFVHWHVIKSWIKFEQVNSIRYVYVYANDINVIENVIFHQLPISLIGTVSLLNFFNEKNALNNYQRARIVLLLLHNGIKSSG